MAKSSFWLPAMARVAGFGDDPSTDISTSLMTGPYMNPTDPTTPDLEAAPSDVNLNPESGPVVPITPGTAGGPTPATGSTGTSSPWSVIGTAFSDIFGNLAKNVLPGVVNKELGTNLPGQTPGIIGTTGATAGRLGTGVAGAPPAAVKAGGSMLLIGAIAIGAFLLLSKKR